MPLSSLKNILRCADENQFAAASYDVFNYESAAWVVKAAEMERVPVMVMFYPDMVSHIPLDIIGKVLRMIAEKSSVPVGVHLDHSRSFEQVLSGIPAGFQSIMFDGSALPFEQNVDISKRVAEAAHIFGVDVESELGHVGSGSKREDFMDPEKYTSVQMAVEFVERTGVDALAVFIGNSHGNYVCEPHLDIKRLDEINNAVSVPLVLHGGSGIPAEQVRESVLHGITKINIGTELFAKFKEVSVKEFSKPEHVIQCLSKQGEEIVEFVRGRLRWFNPKGYKLTEVIGTRY